MWALLPVKRFAAGKSRLAALLSPEQRSELICSMLDDVLKALRRARCVEGVIVLSNEPGIDHVLKAASVERRPEAHEGDLNYSLMAIADSLAANVRKLLILPADVPTVAAADIDALGRACAQGIVLSPAALDGGTNALLSFLPLSIPLCFGERSLARHVENAGRRAVAVQVIPCRGLLRDMDREEDLHWLAESPHSVRTSSFVRRLLRRRADFETR